MVGNLLAVHLSLCLHILAADEVRPWAHESSEVPIQKGITFGVLESGLRYAWAAESSPEDKCFVRLHVDVGSLREKKNERGIAHYLEHMGFNGTKNFPPGKLVKWLQRQGLRFGADSNAYTSFDETVYRLDLPKADDETILSALRVLRDFADQMLLRKEEIDAERTIIDAEERERDTVENRMWIEFLKSKLNGTLYPERLPIGVKEVRDKFNRNSFRKFYKRWYRPELMTLVLVGDLGERDPTPWIEQTFSKMKRRSSKLPKPPKIGRPKGQRHFTVFEEDALAEVVLTIERLKPFEDEKIDRESIGREILEQCALEMLESRLRLEASREGAFITEASCSSVDDYRVLEGVGVRVHCAATWWREALVAAENAWRQALEFGFHESEYEAARDEVFRRYNVRYNALGIANNLVSAAAGHHIPIDPSYLAEVARSILTNSTAEDCRDLLRRSWEDGETFVAMGGPLDLGEDPAGVLREAYEAANAASVEPLAEASDITFAYHSDIPDLTSDDFEVIQNVEDLKFSQFKFKNGVRLNVMPEHGNGILVSVRFGNGYRSLEPSQYAVGWLADRVFTSCGLGKHTTDEIALLTRGLRISTRFDVESDSCILTGSTTTVGLLPQCQILCAYLSDPGWSDEGLWSVLSRLETSYEDLAQRPAGLVATEFLPILAGGDRRFGFPKFEDIEALEITDIEEWLGPQIEESPLEVSIVGSMRIELALVIAYATFGQLPPRESGSESPDLDAPKLKPGVRREIELQGNSTTTSISIIYPLGEKLAEGLDRRTHCQLELLSGILSDRLREEVREKLGAAYSPYARVSSSDVFPDNPWIRVGIEAKPEQVDDVVELCLSIGERLVVGGVTLEEADRVRRPTLANLEASKRGNWYWLDLLRASQGTPESLDIARSMSQYYSGASAMTLSQLAGRLLRAERASICVIKPKEP